MEAGIVWLELKSSPSRVANIIIIALVVVIIILLTYAAGRTYSKKYFLWQPLMATTIFFHEHL